jgi:hypothetical protein
MKLYIVSSRLTKVKSMSYTEEKARPYAHLEAPDYLESNTL